jgi:hypothetical protein
MGPRANLDVLKNREISFPWRDSNTGPSACVLVGVTANGGTHSNHQNLKVKLA